MSPPRDRFIRGIGVSEIGAAPAHLHTREIFVGRDDELERIERALDDVEHGRERVVMLFGEPGIGKTRTIRRSIEEDSHQGVEVLWGRCFEGIGAPHYWPWIEILRDYLERHADDEAISRMDPHTAAAIAEVDPRAAGFLGDLPKLERMEDPFSARFRFLDAYTTFIKGAAKDNLLALVLEDLHWADNSSLVLLEFLSHHIAEIPILIIGSYRDVELIRCDRLSAI